MLLSYRSVHSVQHILTDRLQLTNQPFGLCLTLDHELAVSGLAAIVRVSRPTELHRQPLAEPSVRLSPHSAPIRQTCRSSRSASARRVLRCSLRCFGESDSRGSYEQQSA